MIILGGSLGSSLAGRTTLSQKLIKEGDQNQVIAIVRVSGVILEDSAADPSFLGSSVVSSSQVIDTLDQLANDQAVRGIIIRVNSPGGSAVASDDIYRKIIEIKSQKPVMTSMGDVAASGGYYIASATDRIFANRATLTGSIGVIAQLPNYSGLYDKLGMEFETVQTGQYKDMGSNSRPLTATEKAIIQSYVDDAFDQFIGAVTTGRHMDEAQVRQLADGRIYSGVQAQANGLIDQLGSLDDTVQAVVDQAELSSPQVIEYSQVNFFNSLLGVKGPIIQLPFSSPETLASYPSGGVYYLSSL